MHGILATLHLRCRGCDQSTASGTRGGTPSACCMSVMRLHDMIIMHARAACSMTVHICNAWTSLMVWHADWPGEGDDGFEKIKSRTEKKKDKLLTMDPTQISYEMVSRKLREITLARGKKGIDRQEQVLTLMHARWPGWLRSHSSHRWPSCRPVMLSIQATSTVCIAVSSSGSWP